jgi:glycosyltransferase involved in cell wall biosynthesis
MASPPRRVSAGGGSDACPGDARTGDARPREGRPGDARAFLGVEDTRTFLVVYAGSLGPLKGIETLLAAAHRLPEIRFAVVGGADADRIGECRRMAPASVHFTGPVAPVDVPRLVAAANASSAPCAVSADSTSRRSRLQYLAAGRAIVATDLRRRDILTGG